jgi:hypothetical protein
MDPFGNKPNFGFPTDPNVPIGLPRGVGFNPIGSNDLDPFAAQGKSGNGMYMGREAFQNKMPDFRPFGDDFDDESPLRKPSMDPMGMVNQGIPDVRGPQPRLGHPLGEMAARDGLRDPSYDDERFKQDDHGPDDMLKHFESRKSQLNMAEKTGKKPIDPFVAANSVPKGAKFDPIAAQGMQGMSGPSGDLSRFGDEAPPPEYNNIYM